MRSSTTISLLVLLATTVGGFADDAFKSKVIPFLDDHCSDCHMDGADDGDVDLDFIVDARDLQLDVRLVHKIRRVLETGEMPPEKKPRPDKAQLAAVQKWLATATSTVAVAPPHDPGRPVIRRLNRTELGYALADLLHVAPEIMDSFPADDTGYGFDTFGPVLNITPLHLERWLTIVEKAVADAFPDRNTLHNARWQIEPEDFQAKDGARMHPYGDGVIMPTNGTTLAPFHAPAPGTYQIHVTLAPMPAGDDPPRFALSHNDTLLLEGQLDGGHGSRKTITRELTLTPGDHFLGISFLNDFWDPSRAEGDRDRNLEVAGVHLRGPLQPAKRIASEAQRRYRIAEDPPARDELATAGRVIRQIATVAWRRAPTDDELRRLGRIFATTRRLGSFQEGIRGTVTAILASPAFLYRQEPTPVDAKPGTIVPLSQQQLATRLALLLWRSLPDPILLEAAEHNRLATDDQIRHQIQRLLADPRAERFASDFCGQWLMLRMLDKHRPARDVFSGWSDKFAGAMRHETEWLFLDVLRSNAPVMTLLHSRRAMVDPQLAHHYGITHSDSPVEKPDHRPGILGHASILTLTSHPTRTSPVRRGKFILDQILGMPPPPAPGDIPPLEEPSSDDAGKPKTVREALNAHASQPDCRGCHNKLDPYGFALEGFDPTGRYLGNRDNPPDVNATMLDGTKINGLNDLVAAIDKDQELVVRTMIENFVVYGLGRAVTRDDYPLILHLTRTTAKSNHGLRDLLEAFILSDAFRKQKVQ